MKPTQALHERGQSLWLDNITRALLDEGRIQHYIDAYSVTGLTSNPSIFDKAIGSGGYDDAIAAKAARGLSGEELFFELAIEDLRRAADEFLGVHERTDGVDGWVSLEVSPLLAHDTERTVEAARALHAQAGRPNLFIKIPGTPEGLPAITQSIAAGVPVNVTLLFSATQYLAAADAYLQGVEQRLAAGLDPAVASVASVFMSRWDVAVAGKVPAELTDRLGLAVGLDTYRAYRQLLGSDRMLRLENDGAAGAAAAVGQHRHQGPGGAGHHVRARPGRAVHHQHDAGQDAGGVLRPRRGGRPDARRRRRLRRGAGRLRRGRGGRAGPGREAAGGRGRGVRRGVEGTAEPDQRAEQRRFLNGRFPERSPG